MRSETFYKAEDLIGWVKRSKIRWEVVEVFHGEGCYLKPSSCPRSGYERMHTVMEDVASGNVEDLVKRYMRLKKLFYWKGNDFDEPGRHNNSGVRTSPTLNQCINVFKENGNRPLRSGQIGEQIAKTTERVSHILSTHKKLFKKCPERKWQLIDPGIAEDEKYKRMMSEDDELISYLAPGEALIFGDLYTRCLDRGKQWSRKELHTRLMRCRRRKKIQMLPHPKTHRNVYSLTP